MKRIKKDEDEEEEEDGDEHGQARFVVSQEIKAR